KKVVTVAMHEVIFIEPVFVGDLVSFYTETVKIGRTSITVKVYVESERIIAAQKQKVKVTEAEVVYVAVNDERRPVPVLD
ncbi:MAG: acyl-CoA thioesterase, partial [Blastocatellia bacterium]|nr:acyl-CoA thioesterase [Blastocatellia bacterium]